jgi:N-acetyl-alpha-D-muramate 1-phosphate uridylyltransferase
VTDPIPAGVALAAGAGTRLRPLTTLRPKALCPVGGRTLVDLALDRLEAELAPGPDRLAVNAHHHAAQIEAHCRGRAHVQVEPGEALGTAGALARMRGWLDGRAALVTNADAYLPGGLTGFTDGWDGERCRLLCRELPAGTRPDFVAADGTGLRYVGACLLPWSRIEGLAETPSGLYEVLWRDDAAAGTLDLVRLPTGTVVIDCGTPADYLAANLHAAGGENVIGVGATVLGRLERSVVWDGAWVGPDEVLSEQIRAGDREHPLTVDGSPAQSLKARPAQS